MLFAGAGYSVYLFDVDAKRIPEALSDIRTQLKNLEAKDMLRLVRTSSRQGLRYLLSNLSDMRPATSGSLG